MMKIEDYKEELYPSFYYIVVVKNKSYYFLSEDKQNITRDCNNAYRVYTIDGYTRYGLESYVQKNIPLPKDYKLFSLFPQSKAQKWLDEYYPLPRKSIPKKVREQVYKMFDGHCAYCGCKIEYKDMQVDHIKSHMINKGIDDISNYYPSCKDCNHFKMCFPIERFRNNIKDTIKTCSKRNQNYLWDRIYRKYGLNENPNKQIVFYFEKIKNGVD